MSLIPVIFPSFSYLKSKEEKSEGGRTIAVLKQKSPEAQTKVFLMIDCPEIYIFIYFKESGWRLFKNFYCMKK